MAEVLLPQVLGQPLPLPRPLLLSPYSPDPLCLSALPLFFSLLHKVFSRACWTPGAVV